MPTIGEMIELEQEIGAKKFQEQAEQKIKQTGNQQTTKSTNPSSKNPSSKNTKFQATKGAPLEKSSKIKPKGLFLQPVNNTLDKKNDPRFSDQHGEFKQSNFDKYYEFLDDVESSEIEKLKQFKNKLAKVRRKKEAKGKSVGTSELEHEAIGAIRSREQRLQAKKDRRMNRKEENKKRKVEIEKVKQGKMPYFSKKFGGKEESKEKVNKRKNMPDGFRRSAKTAGFYGE